MEIMSGPRQLRLGGGVRTGPADAPAAGTAGTCSLGWRHRRSSGSIQPRSGDSGSSGSAPPSSRPGSPPSGSSGGPLTWARLPRTPRKVPSHQRAAVPWHLHVAGPGHRPRHGQHARLRQGEGPGAQRAHRRGARLAQPGGPGDRDGRLADDRPHARLHRGGAPAARRRHHRLRGDRADAQRPVAPGRRRAAQPAQGPDLRPLGHHGGRAPGGQGGGASGRRVVELPDRAADGGGDRGGPARSTSRWGTWWSTSAAARPRWR